MPCQPNNDYFVPLTKLVVTTRVTFIVPASKKATGSVRLTPVRGVHSPTLRRAWDFSFRRSNLKLVRRPSRNCTGPVNPLYSTCKRDLFISINFYFRLTLMWWRWHSKKKKYRLKHYRAGCTDDWFRSTFVAEAWCVLLFVYTLIHITFCSFSQ